MILYRNCPLCNSTKSKKALLIDTKRKGFRFQEWSVFLWARIATPWQSQKELLDYYQKLLWERFSMRAINYKEISLNCSFISELSKNLDLKKRSKYFQKFEGVHFLDYMMRIGFRISLCKSVECKLYATEFDSGALEFVKKNHFRLRPFREIFWEANYLFWVFWFYFIFSTCDWACF